jgi:signal transduction histidine kinase
MDVGLPNLDAQPGCVAVMLPDGAAVAETLRARGYGVRLFDSAADLAAALGAATGPRPECAVLALDEPGLSGVIEALEVSSDVPILVGVYRPDAVAVALAHLRAGFFDCVPGPLAPEEAGFLVGAALAERRQRHDRPSLASRERQGHFEAMATFAETVLGIRHDLNNPLCAISLNAQLLGMALADQPRMADRVRAIEENVRRIQLILQRLATEKHAPIRTPDPAPVGS